MEQFGFNTLSEDDHLVILKYLPIKERVRFERINTSWASLLNRLWLIQKQLQFGAYFHLLANCHPVEHYDRYGNYRYDPPVEAILKIISGCTNLRVLEVDSDVFDQLSLATQLANVLNVICKELVHLNIWSINLEFFELFKPSDKFICLINLKYAGLKLFYDKNKITGQLPLKVVNLLHEKFNPLTWSLINKVTVEHLTANRWNEHYNELINLTWLQVIRADSDQVGNFNQLEHIGLGSATPSGLRRIFENSRKLESLMLRNEADDVMDTIFKFGLNLKQLNVNFGKVASFDKFWQNVPKLTKLRSLRVRMDVYLKDKELNMGAILTIVLKKCTKLKYLKFYCHANAVDFASEDEKEQIRKLVADKSLRQSFKVSFESSCYCHDLLIERGSDL